MRDFVFARFVFTATSIAFVLSIAGSAQTLSPAPSEQLQTTPSDAAQAEASMPPAPPAEVVANAQSIVRLSDVEGSVHLSDSTGKVFDQVLQNMAMLPGMTLQTDSDGRAELEFPDGSVVRVTPNSALELHEGAGKASLLPTKGLTFYELAPGSGNTVQIGQFTARAMQGRDAIPGTNQTSNATSAQSSTPAQVVLRVNLDTAPYQVAVLRGTVHFEDASGNAAYNLEANQTSRIDPLEATNYDVVQYVAPDTWDAWNADRDSTLAQIAGVSHTGGENDRPGWSDLNYYGSWYDVPGEGMAWAPDGVGQNFDPYGSGAWGYYSGVGYGWVSSYPWGWLPYHCGLWNYYQSNGWMWLPANCGWGAGYGNGYAGWYGYSGFGATPRNYLGPTRPLPPRGIRHLPSSQTLIAVHQGPPVHFRELGDPRPAPRTLVIAGIPVRPMPVEARPSYSTVVPGSGFRATSAGGRLLGAEPSASRSVMQAPRVSGSAPAPRMSAPPPMSAPMSSPHMSAPAASSGGHSH